MKKVITLSILFFATWGCKTRDNDSSGSRDIVWQNQEVVDLNKDSDIPIFNLIDSMEFVQLETTDLCLISTIERVLIYKDCFYIFDQRQQTVFCFNRNGEFLRRIGEQGRGPQEYEYLENISIDPYNEQLLLVVPFGSVLCFDLEGNFMSKISIPDAGAINELHVLDAEHWLFTSLNDYQILYFSKKYGQLMERLFERSPKLFPLWRAYAYKDSIYFSPILSNQTINMSNVNRQTAFSWDFGSNNNRPRRIKSLLRELQKLDNQPNIAGIDKVTEAMNLRDRFLNHYIRFTRESSRYRIAVLEYKKGEYMHVVFDKQEHKTAVFRKTKEGIRWVNPDFMLNQDMVIAYDIDRISNIIYTKEILSSKQRKMVEANNPETDNPFLVVYHLKK